MVAEKEQEEKEDEQTELEDEEGIDLAREGSLVTD